MPPENFGILLADERREPQPGAEALFMDLIRRTAQSLREFLRVRRQPVAHGRLPPVVDLENVARGKHPGAAVKIGKNALLVDVLVAVVPARIPGNAFDGLFRQSHGGKPAVENLALRPLAIKEIKDGERSAAAHPGAVPREGELSGVGVVTEERVPARFVERREQSEALAAPPIGIGFAVRNARRFRIIGEIVIAVALQSERLDPRKPGRKGMGIPVRRVLRRVRPALKAVDEDPLVRLAGEKRRRRNGLQNTVRQLARDVVFPVPQQSAAGIDIAVFQFHAPKKFHNFTPVRRFFP